MSEVVYVSNVRIVRERGAMRRATLPAEPLPVTFGVHGAIARHYGVDETILEPHATTIDYLIAAAAG